MKTLHTKILAAAMALIITLTLLPFVAQPASAFGDMGKAGYLTTISISNGNSAAVAANGDLYVWGNNFNGQLGLGNYGEGTHKTSPTKVPGLSNVVSVSIGHSFCAALTASGDIYTWGSNRYGQIGSGKSGQGVYVTSPTKVPGISNVVAINMGCYHSSAVTANGDLYVWGYNDFGQLGLGDETDRTTPTKVPGLSNVVAASMGYTHSAALTASGDIYIWGSNVDGQLGLGDRTKRLTPTKVPGLPKVVAIGMGGGGISNHSAAVTSDGYRTGEGVH